MVALFRDKNINDNKIILSPNFKEYTPEGYLSFVNCNYELGVLLADILKVLPYLCRHYKVIGEYYLAVGFSIFFKKIKHSHIQHLHTNLFILSVNNLIYRRLQIGYRLKKKNKNL